MNGRKKKSKKQTKLGSDQPNLYGEIVLNDGAPVSCGDVNASCCYSQQNAREACGKLYGEQYGYSNTSAHAISPDSKKYINCPRGQPYECRAIVTPNCPTRQVWPYNKNGIYGSHKPYWQEPPFTDCAKNGPNAVLVTPKPGSPEFNKYGYHCAIFDWKVERTEECCTPGSQTKPGLYETDCSPQTCFGKPACDRAIITQQICSDKDNVAKDPACVDTCIRLNEGGTSWCNAPIKAYCQGKNLETDVCRQFCTATNLDKNEDLANFCDNAYVNYCKSTDYNTYDRKRQDQLCGCINSPLPVANCVDAKCTNGIAIKTKSLRQNDGKCPTNICIQEIFIDANGNPIINIDHTKWTQICPGVPEPGTNPNPPGPGPFPPSPSSSKSIQNLELYIGGPLLLILLIVALVFLFKK